MREKNEHKYKREKLDKLIKDNPMLAGALKCIVEKAHPVYIFAQLTGGKETAITGDETYIARVTLDAERRKLLSQQNTKYKAFEMQVKQCLIGFEKFAKEYNIKL